MSKTKLWMFEGKMQSTSAITAQCSAWSAKYVATAVRNGAASVADISALWEAGLAKKMANCKKPALPQQRIIVAMGTGGHSLPNYEYRMLFR